MIFQRTLKKPVSVAGVGLHSGQQIQLTLRPASPNQGIHFVRTDLEGAPEVSAQHKNVINTQMATTLGIGKVTIGTVEHLMAALQILGVDNAVIEVDGPEVPIFDGSAHHFCEAIGAVGLESQLQSRAFLALKRKVELKIGEKWAVAEPCSRLEIYGSVDWEHPSIGYQEFHYVEGQTAVDELSRARTFGFLRDYEALKKMGLARGGSLDTAVVMDDHAVLNPGGLRYKNEFARHKVLDALGDFKLAGLSIQAFFRLHRAGHDLHSQLLTAIFRDSDNFEIIESSFKEEPRPLRIHASASRRGVLASY